MPSKDNSGALFKNEHKRNSKSPDYRGPCMIDGREKEISAWIAESKDGKKYMSLKFSEPYRKNDSDGGDPFGGGQ